MTQEDRELLLKDLSARLLYGTKCLIDYDKTFDGGVVSTLQGINDNRLYLYRIVDAYEVDHVRPYLRPMSSMTDEENEEYIKRNLYGFHWDFVDWCNSKHLDYRGLIDRGLALEASEGIYI